MQLDRHFFLTPPWILDSYNIIGMVQLVINIFSIFMIVFKSSKLASFRFYLLGFQICVALTESFVISIFKPIFLLPIQAVYSVGIGTTYFNLTTHYCVIITVILLSNQHSAISLSILRKHYSISRLSLDTSKWVYLILSFFGEFFKVLVVFLILSLDMERQESLSYISQEYHEHLQEFQSLDSFAIYITSFKFYLLLFICATGLSSLFSGCAYFTIDMLRILKKNEHKLSKANTLKHRSALKGLVAQMLASGVMIIPFIILEAVVFLKVENERSFANFNTFQVCWFSAIVHILIDILACHSTLNFIVLITTYQPYRRFMSSLMFWKNNKVSKIHPNVFTVE